MEQNVVNDSSVPMIIFSDIQDPTKWETGMLEGFKIIESPNIPEPPRPRQNVNAFIHRKAGHYGF